MIKHVLEADSIMKSFTGKLIISDAYVLLETGQIIGLLGRNGSGKSTLLKIIFGIVAADFKFIRVNGIIKSNTAELLNEVSYLDQDNFIPQRFSVRKAISLSIASRNIGAFYHDDMIQQIKDKKIKHLSGGELRYLEIKLILSANTKFALLDEPYNGLSPLAIEKINELILENAGRKGIIITDHSYENVIKVSNKLILMKDGKTHHLQDQSELIAKGYLSEGML